MSDFPAQLGGTDKLVGWLNKLRSAAMESRLTSVVNGRYARGPGGTQLVCGGDNVSKTVVFGEYLLKSVRANDLVCHTWDGTNEGSDDISVAKCYELTSISSEVIDGTTVNYSYGSTVARTASNGGAYTETHVISPRWIPNTSIIWAAKIHYDVPGVGAWDWVDLNIASRAWTRIQ